VRFRRIAGMAALAIMLAPIAALEPMAPPRVAATAALPACGYSDVETAFTSPDDWQRTLVDTTFMVGRSYVPPDLVPVTDAGISGNGSIRALVIPDLAAMASAANAAGAPIAVQSAYRSYATQVYTFNYWTEQYGSSAALLGSARPGHSEHQLGVAIDFTSAGDTTQYVGDWATTPAGAWMASNAWKYGFVMSYPKATSPAVTCYQYEPWHYRYVGRDEAAAIHASGVTVREYLWSQLGNDVMASWSGGSRAATPAGVPGGTPAPSPAATPLATGTPVASPAPAVAAALPPAPPPGTTHGAAPIGTADAPAFSAQPAGSSGTPVDLLLRVLGMMLGIVVGLGILVAAERLDQAARRLMRREVRPRWVARRA